ncbi:MAG: SpoIID/LytB domain-containing protein [Clostridium sp.]|nr:SpoIID/LytB domain-containing protein [Prevotella sp.]MCM1428240.1 SpoIID/LytB domain-containing protein [Clostridium sp.]
MNEQEPVIRVGLHTDGPPRLRRDGDEWRLSNLLIGKGFHWQRKLEVVLPEEVSVLSNRNFVVNTLPVESYLLCVAASEMNPLAPKEFLKAHAIISRSWVMRRLSGREFVKANNDGKIKGALYKDIQGRDGQIFITWEDEADHHDDPFDVCGDDHCQRYQGRQSTPQATLNAIRSTRGIVLTDPNGGGIADCRFYKSCGGHTERFSSCWQNVDPEYLRSVPDKWCNLSSVEPTLRLSLLHRILKSYDLDTRNCNDVWNTWHRKISLEDVRLRILSTYGCDTGNISDIRVVERGSSGRIILLEFRGSRMSVIIGKELAIRRLLADNCLMSSAFSLTIRDEMLLLEGKGWGHGVGLCQIGAARMAAEGYSCNDILSFYYPGTIPFKLY